MTDRANMPPPAGIGEIGKSGSHGFALPFTIAFLLMGKPLFTYSCLIDTASPLPLSPTLRPCPLGDTQDGTGSGVANHDALQLVSRNWVHWVGRFPFN